MAQRTTINLGAIAVEVSLTKTSSEPKAAKWETKTVNADGSPITVSLSDQVNLGAPSALVDVKVPDVVPIEFESEARYVVDAGVAEDPFGDREPAPEAEPAAEPTPTPVPATKVLRGVTNAEGEFVDVGDRLEQIDADVKLDGMEVVGAIGSGTIPRERVLGSSYVVPVDETGKRACAMLFDALGKGQRALAVRWTKRTNQALGIIVASKTHDCLVLLEVEFSANMKEAPPKARLGKLRLTLTDDECAAADRFVGAIAGKRSDLDEIVDERRTRHAELLTAAREGKLEDYDAAHLADAEVVEDEFEREFGDVLAGRA